MPALFTTGTWRDQLRHETWMVRQGRAFEPLLSIESTVSGALELSSSALGGMGVGGLSSGIHDPREKKKKKKKEKEKEKKKRNENQITLGRPLFSHLKHEAGDLPQRCTVPDDFERSGERYLFGKGERGPLENESGSQPQIPIGISTVDWC